MLESQTSDQTLIDEIRLLTRRRQILDKL